MENGWLFDGWYFGQAEELLGPVSAGELRQLVAVGGLAPADQVWQRWTRGPDSLLLPLRAREAALDRATLLPRTWWQS